MLTPNEEKFLQHWQQERTSKKKFLRKLSVGLPLAVVIAVAVMVNLFSGWYERANMEFNSDPTLIIVILVALLGIVVFITIFSAHHRWDQNESAYQELLKRKHNDAAVQQQQTN